MSNGDDKKKVLTKAEKQRNILAAVSAVLALILVLLLILCLPKC